MKERSIQYSPLLAAANRANFDPKKPQVKTQTRRLSGLTDVNKHPDRWYLNSVEYHDFHTEGKGTVAYFKDATCDFSKFGQCPYGVPGDLLYVKEEHYAFGSWKLTGQKTKKGNDKWAFEAKKAYGIRFNDNPPANPTTGVDRSGELNWQKRNSLFMPKAYAQQWSIIESVGCERLASISEEDAIQEGATFDPDNGYHTGDGDTWSIGLNTAKGVFCWLWMDINGIESWEQNPWVWVIKYKPLSITGKPETSIITKERERIFAALQVADKQPKTLAL